MLFHSLPCKKITFFSPKTFQVFFTVFIVSCKLLNNSSKSIKISSSLLHKHKLRFMNENKFWQKYTMKFHIKKTLTTKPSKIPFNFFNCMVSLLLCMIVIRNFSCLDNFSEYLISLSPKMPISRNP